MWSVHLTYLAPPEVTGRWYDARQAPRRPQHEHASAYYGCECRTSLLVFICCASSPFTKHVQNIEHHTKHAVPNRIREMIRSLRTQSSVWPFDTKRSTKVIRTIATEASITILVEVNSIKLRRKSPFARKLILQPSLSGESVCFRHSGNLDFSDK